MRIYVCPCVEKEKSMAALPSVISALCGFGIESVMLDTMQSRYNDERVVYLPADAEGDMITDCDMLLTVGGDGMMLKWGKRAAFAGKPLVGINTGRLGFMTAIDADETQRLEALADDTYTLSRRMMLKAVIKRKEPEDGYTALNDIVLFKDVRSKLPEFTVRINGTIVTRLRADGIIFSTPTGSTAYALSAGGPIIEPTVECIQMTPLCAHTLLDRPMIFSGSDIVTVSCTPYEGSRVNMSVDGGSGIELTADDELVIRKSGVTLELVELGGNSFYDTVGKKLMTPIK